MECHTCHGQIFALRVDSHFKCSIVEQLQRRTDTVIHISLNPNGFFETTFTRCGDTVARLYLMTPAAA